MIADDDRRLGATGASRTRSRCPGRGLSARRFRIRLAELVRELVSEPAGLDDTEMLDGRGIAPAGYRHGVFAFNGTPTATSGFGAVSYLTWNQATNSLVSTPTDLLDLLDVWAAGELFTTDRTPAPNRYAPDPAGNPTPTSASACHSTDTAPAPKSTAASSPPPSAATRGTRHANLPLAVHRRHLHRGQREQQRSDRPSRPPSRGGRAARHRRRSPLTDRQRAVSTWCMTMFGPSRAGLVTTGTGSAIWSMGSPPTWACRV